MNETLGDFPVHRFIQELFEDLSLTLPALGCQFQGVVTESDLTANGQRTYLKNKLFLLYADLATTTPTIKTKCSLAMTGDKIELCFYCQPYNPDRCGALPSWDQSLFHNVHLNDGEGFSLALSPGKPIEIGPPINWRELGRLYGSPDNGQKVLGHFVERSRVLVPELGQKILADDCNEVLRIAHTLKGSARGVTAIELSNAALKLEMLGRGKDLTQAGALYKALLESYDAFMACVEER